MIFKAISYNLENIQLWMVFKKIETKVNNLLNYILKLFMC